MVWIHNLNDFRPNSMWFFYLATTWGFPEVADFYSFWHFYRYNVVQLRYEAFLNTRTRPWGNHQTPRSNIWWSKILLLMSSVLRRPIFEYQFLKKASYPDILKVHCLQRVCEVNVMNPLRSLRIFFSNLFIFSILRRYRLRGIKHSASI